MRSQRMKSIDDVLEEVEVLIDTHFFNEFCETKSSTVLKKVIANQSAIDMTIIKRTWQTLNCSPKTMKIIREIQENLLCVGRRRELITKKKTESKCWCSKTGLPLNARHIVSCCRKVSAEINTRHDTIVNILLNNIIRQRGLISHEQKWEDRKMVRTPTDEVTIGTEHWRSDEWKRKGRVAGAKLKPDLVWLRKDSGGDWRKVVGDVKITSTDKMSEAVKEKDDKYREWATKETREKKGGDGGNGANHHLQRRGCPQGHHQKMEKLCLRYHCRLGPDGPERASLQCRDCGEVLQQGKLGLRGVEKTTP